MPGPFNATYELLLQLIARYFSFGHETAQRRRVLAHTAVGLMFRVIQPLGLLFARLPIGPDHPDVTAGANFQLPYRASLLLPHRRAAWLRFVERLDELAAFADGVRPEALAPFLCRRRMGRDPPGFSGFEPPALEEPAQRVVDGVLCRS